MQGHDPDVRSTPRSASKALFLNELHRGIWAPTSSTTETRLTSSRAWCILIHEGTAERRREALREPSIPGAAERYSRADRQALNTGGK